MKTHVEVADSPRLFVQSLETVKLGDLIISLSKDYMQLYGTVPDQKAIKQVRFYFQTCFQVYCYHPLHLAYINEPERLERDDCLERFIHVREIRSLKKQPIGAFFDFGCKHDPFCHLGGPLTDLPLPFSKRCADSDEVAVKSS